MIRSIRSRTPLAALLGATVALGACGSGGGDGTDPPVSAQDPSAAPVDDDPGVLDDVLVDVPDGAPTDDPDDVPVGVPAAGGDTGAGAPSDIASRFGVLAVNRGDAAESGIIAAFYGLDEGVPLGDLAADALPAPDTCAFGSVSAGDIDLEAGPEVPELDGPGPASLSAGANIVVSGPGGTFATLQRVSAGGFVAYLTEDGTVPAPIPSGLVADIPGDEFPAFANVVVPDTPPMTGVTPVGLAGVSAGTTFGWDAGDDETVRVIVEIALADTDPLVSVSCYAADDGEFRLPASLLARVPAERPAVATLARVGLRVLREGDAVLVVTSGAVAFEGLRP